MGEEEKLTKAMGTAPACRTAMMTAVMLMATWSVQAVLCHIYCWDDCYETQATVDLVLARCVQLEATVFRPVATFQA